MVWFRILLALAAVGVVGSVLAWLFTQERRYLNWAVNILRLGLGAGLLFKEE